MARPDGRQPDQLRPLTFTRRFPGRAGGSVLVASGRTVVLCTCSAEPGVPPFLVGTGKGWLTAEYNMLPGSTRPRKARERGGKAVDGRTVEIQRLIGRSLRAVVDLDRLGERTLWLDCDVIEADGGTRTAAINGAFLALLDALRAIPEPLPVPLPQLVRTNVAAVSVGLLEGAARLDLNYLEDRDADVDLNLVMTGTGEIVEVQAGGEEATFSPAQLNELIALGQRGVAAITELQRHALGAEWLW
jgi:ribonuclease PH